MTIIYYYYDMTILFSVCSIQHDNYYQNGSSVSLAKNLFLIPTFRRLSRHYHQGMEDTHFACILKGGGEGDEVGEGVK